MPIKREQVFKHYLREGSTVLDVGSTGQTPHYSLWNFLREQKVDLTGIDVVAHDDKDIVVGNMESYDFQRQFDVIIAGDVLEHVENQGLFLRNIARHMRDDSVFILTTPNTKWPTVVFRPNPTHTLWHDRHTLKYVLGLSGLKIEKFSYYPGNKYHYPFYILPLVWRQGMLAVCRKREDD